jgi:hypothetical protein
MALTSASTITDAYNQWKNNLLWDGDITKAKNALEAARYLLACRPEQIASETGVSMRFSDMENEVTKLESFVGRLSSTINRAQFTRANMRIY